MPFLQGAPGWVHSFSPTFVLTAMLRESDLPKVRKEAAWLSQDLNPGLPDQSPILKPQSWLQGPSSEKLNSDDWKHSAMTGIWPYIGLFCPRPAQPWGTASPQIVNWQGEKLAEGSLYSKPIHCLFWPAAYLMANPIIFSHSSKVRNACFFYGCSTPLVTTTNDSGAGHWCGMHVDLMGSLPPPPPMQLEGGEYKFSLSAVTQQVATHGFGACCGSWCVVARLSRPSLWLWFGVYCTYVRHCLHCGTLSQSLRFTKSAHLTILPAQQIYTTIAAGWVFLVAAQQLWHFLLWYGTCQHLDIFPDDLTRTLRFI